MRVLKILVALLATPVLVAVSQSGGQAATGASAAGRCATADEQRSSSAPVHQDKQGRPRVGCSPAAAAVVTPPPASLPPPPPADQPPATASIDVGVYYVSPFAPKLPLPGFAVVISGPMPYTGVTDNAGRVLVTGLPPGAYVACQLLPAGWGQDAPTGGACISFPINAGESQSGEFHNSIR
jgi:hypothetical protein